MELANGWTTDFPNEQTKRRLNQDGYMDIVPLNEDEIRGLTGYYKSPEYINGRAEAERQAAADNDFDFGNLIVPALMAGVGGLFASGIPGISNLFSGGGADYASPATEAAGSSQIPGAFTGFKGTIDPSVIRGAGTVAQSVFGSESDVDLGFGTTGTDPGGAVDAATRAAAGGEGFPDWYNDAIKALPAGATAGKSLLDMFKSLTGGTSGTSMGTGDYSFPFSKVLGGLLESYGKKEQSNDLKGYLDKALSYADPFHDQRPRYQAELPGAFQRFRDTADTQNTGFNKLFQGYKTTSDRFQDPEYWNKDSLLAGLNQNTMSDTQRELSAKGYNMSGNVPMEVAQRLQRNNATYVPQFMDTFNRGAQGYLNSYTSNAGQNINAAGQNAINVGTAAGYNQGPGAAGQIAGALGPAIAGLNNSALGGIGAATNAVLNGNQPTYNQQRNGTGLNQTLSDVITGLYREGGGGGWPGLPADYPGASTPSVTGPAQDAWTMLSPEERQRQMNVSIDQRRASGEDMRIVDYLQSMNQPYSVDSGGLSTASAGRGELRAGPGDNTAWDQLEAEEQNRRRMASGNTRSFQDVMANFSSGTPKTIFNQYESLT